MPSDSWYRVLDWASPQLLQVLIIKPVMVVNPAGGLRVAATVSVFLRGHDLHCSPRTLRAMGDMVLTLGVGGGKCWCIPLEGW